MIGAWFFNAVYLALLVAATPWLIWRRATQGKRLPGLWQKLTGTAPLSPTGERPIWFHAVSVGEVNLLIPLIAELRRAAPGVPFVISTTTHSGWQVAASRFPDATRLFWPFDFSWAVRRALRRVNPRQVVLAELELWPNFLRAAEQSGIPVAIVNGRLSERSWRGYRRWAVAARPMFRRVGLIAAQSAADARRFADLVGDEERILVTGNVKFDGVNQNRLRPETGRLVEEYGIEGDEIVWLAGSTQPEEDRLVVSVYQRLRKTCPQLRLVVAPRHPPNAPSLIADLESRHLPFVVRSRGARPSAEAPGKPVIVIDVLGELSHWWARADLAYVGGSLGRRGGQNMLEPAAVGAAVSFGPHTQNFRDVVERLLAAEAAVVVKNGEELTAFVRRGGEDPEWREELGRRAQEVVQANCGATEKTVRALLENQNQSPIARLGRMGKAA